MGSGTETNPKDSVKPLIALIERVFKDQDVKAGFFQRLIAELGKNWKIVVWPLMLPFVAGISANLFALFQKLFFSIPYRDSLDVTLGYANGSLKYLVENSGKLLFPNFVLMSTIFVWGGWLIGRRNKRISREVKDDAKSMVHVVSWEGMEHVSPPTRGDLQQTLLIRGSLDSLPPLSILYHGKKAKEDFLVLVCDAEYVPMYSNQINPIYVDEIPDNMLERINPKILNLLPSAKKINGRWTRMCIPIRFGFQEIILNPNRVSPGFLANIDPDNVDQYSKISIKTLLKSLDENFKIGLWDVPHATLCHMAGLGPMVHPPQDIVVQNYLAEQKSCLEELQSKAIRTGKPIDEELEKKVKGNMSKTTEAILSEDRKSREGRQRTDYWKYRTEPLILETQLEEIYRVIEEENAWDKFVLIQSCDQIIRSLTKDTQEVGIVLGAGTWAITPESMMWRNNPVKSIPPSKFEGNLVFLDCAAVLGGGKHARGANNVFFGMVEHWLQPQSQFAIQGYSSNGDKLQISNSDSKVEPKPGSSDGIAFDGPDIYMRACPVAQVAIETLLEKRRIEMATMVKNDYSPFLNTLADFIEDGGKATLRPKPINFETEFWNRLSEKIPR